MDNTIKNYPFNTVAAKVYDNAKPLEIRLFVEPTKEYLQKNMKTLADTYKDKDKAMKDYFLVYYAKGFDEHSFLLNERPLKFDSYNFKSLSEFGTMLDNAANVDDFFVSKTRLNCAVLALNKLGIKIGLNEINKGESQAAINHLASPYNFRSAAKTVLDDFINIGAKAFDMKPEEVIKLFIKSSPK